MPDDTPHYGSLFLGILVLLVGSAIMLGGAAMLRRRVKDDSGAGAENFSLSQLRSLHKRGELTTDEYEKARALILGAAAAAISKPEDAPRAPHVKPTPEVVIEEDDEDEGDAWKTR